MSAEAFFERLARLRRDAGRREQPEQASAQAGLAGPALAGALPPWFAARWARSERARESAGELSSAGLARGLPERLVEEAGPLGPCAARTTRFSCDHRHGRWRLDEAFAAEPGVFELLTRGRFSGSSDPRAAVFFDIETTGLSGGSGTHVFLVGLGWFEEREFAIWQGFLRGPEEERAFLAAVGKRIRTRAQLVSFFGKSFDRHRLEDRLRIQRLEPPFEGRAHLDLYYAARAVYGGAFQDLRLATLERELVGLERRGDLPGAFAPAAWMDFLAERAHRLEQVLAHNLDDVLSLVTLYAHLGRARSGIRVEGQALGPGERVAALRERALERLQAPSRRGRRGRRGSAAVRGA